MAQPVLNDTLSARAPTATGELSLVRRVVRNMAVVDWIGFVYFGILASALLATRNANCWGSLKDVCIDWAMLAVMLVLVRGEVIRGVAASALFRVGICVPIVLSYFQLRWILPAVTSKSLDPEIYAFDLRVFHYEPSVAWDKYVTHGTVEWFAFFYFGYFVIVACNVLPFLALGGDGKLLRHFGTGLVAQFCFTHLLYMVVPGFGPYHELRFEHELHGGMFWALVLHSVHSAGALKDIFPSLHTGAPTFFAIFAFVHRKKFPFRYAWPILAFCALQIIGATMFLRWHYLVDIVAGASLATFNVLFWGRVVDWELGRRQQTGLPGIWGPAPLPGFVDRVIARRAR
ncbi:MAG TPA: phosphatase PAP2 family protein [Polyangiaceae bacterium]|jgi:hypothetical protein